RHGLPSGEVAGLRLAKAEPHRGRLDRLHDDRALGPADRELPALARPDFHRRGFEHGDSALEFEDRHRVIRESVLAGAVMAEEWGDRTGTAQEVDHGIDEVAAKIEH